MRKVMIIRLGIATAITALGAAGAITSGCTSSSSTSGDAGTGDSGSTSSGSSSGSSSGGDGGSTDSGTPPVVCADAGNDTACVNPSTGANDFCVSQECNACTPVTDDGNCATAYGAGNICVGGACVTGNCHTSANCTAGNGDANEICGVNTPNTCGACTNDAQCQADPVYGSSYICTTATGSTQGQCVPGTCGTSGTGGAVNGPCTANTSDECCGGGVADTCIPGNCCTSTQCTSGQTCQNHTCTACALTTGNAYYVDPANGTDNGHTGASTCPFKTITKALEFIGANAAAGTTIQLLDNDPATNGETFPIIVPQNVIIETAAAGVDGGAVSTATITVVAGKAGFELNAPSSGLSNLVIDGNTNQATTGIAVLTGAVTATTSVVNVTVQNFLRPGIAVGGGGVTLGPGLDVTGNGTTANPAPGVQIVGGTATIVGTAAAGTAGHTSIHANTQHGVLVEEAGGVTITGGSTPVTAANTAFVDLDANHVAGLWISQTPGNATVPTNAVTGVEITGIIAGNGIRVTGGSSLVLRGSYVVGNADSGVDITAFGAGVTSNVSLAGIDLGSANVDGNNTLQGTGSSVNPVAGVCVGIPAAATNGQTLNAVGNVWGSVNCATTAGTVSHTNNCQNGSDTDIGGIKGTGNANSALVTMCTLQ